MIQKGKSFNADFISIAPKGETTHYILRVASALSKCVRCAPKGNPQPSAPQALSPPERSGAQPFYTTRGKAAPLFYNLRRQPPPQPSAPTALSNFRTLVPIGRINLKNLFTQPFYITCGEAAPPHNSPFQKSGIWIIIKNGKLGYAYAGNDYSLRRSGKEGHHGFIHQGYTDTGLF